MGRPWTICAATTLLASLLLLLATTARAVELAPVVDALDPPLADPGLPDGAEVVRQGADPAADQWDATCLSCDGTGCDMCQGGIEVGGTGLTLFGGAEYLAARPTFSQSLAFVRQVRPSGTGSEGASENVDQDVNFSFDREDTVRAFIGLRQNDCLSELRFTYWRLQSDDQVNRAAGADAGGNDVSYDIWDVAAAVPGDQLVASSRVTGDVYDIQYKRSVRRMDACDMADVCCLPWSLQWSAGVRIADWAHDTSVVSTSASATQVDTSMEFDGAGPMVGLDGRRALRLLPRASVYTSFQTALLLGQYDHRLVRTAIVGPNTSREIFTRGDDRMVPVTELEAGVAWQFGHCLNISGGWFQQVWWDLGMEGDVVRGDIGFHRDDANIMAWDGFTLRAEFSY